MWLYIYIYIYVCIYRCLDDIKISLYVIKRPVIAVCHKIGLCKSWDVITHGMQCIYTYMYIYIYIDIYIHIYIYIYVYIYTTHHVKPADYSSWCNAMLPMSSPMTYMLHASYDTNASYRSYGTHASCRYYWGRFYSGKVVCRKSFHRIHSVRYHSIEYIL